MGKRGWFIPPGITNDCIKAYNDGVYPDDVVPEDSPAETFDEFFDEDRDQRLGDHFVDNLDIIFVDDIESDKTKEAYKSSIISENCEECASHPCGKDVSCCKTPFWYMSSGDTHHDVSDTVVVDYNYLLIDPSSSLIGHPKYRSYPRLELVIAINSVYDNSARKTVSAAKDIEDNIIDRIVSEKNITASNITRKVL